MATIPNLYLKWRVLRELITMPLSDAQYGAAIFGADREGAPKFSKLLYGDYGCPPEIGTELVAIINRRIENYRKSRNLHTPSGDPFRTSDLDRPLYEFTRKLIAAAEAIDEEALDRTQDSLLREMMPTLGAEGAARLVIELYDTERSFEGMKPSGGPGPLVFRAGRHKGRLAVLGVGREPAMAYTFLARDPRAAGHRSWDLNWGETMLWLPSPSHPRLVDGALLLMEEPTAVQAVPGRFLATTVLVWDASAQTLLDPRGQASKPEALNEPDTSRFLTNLRRLAKRQPNAVTASSAEYFVEV